MHRNINPPKAERDESIQTIENTALFPQKASNKISKVLITEKSHPLPQASCLRTVEIQVSVDAHTRGPHGAPVRFLTSLRSLAGMCEGLASSPSRGSITVTSANSSTDS